MYPPHRGQTVSCCACIRHIGLLLAVPTEISRDDVPDVGPIRIHVMLWRWRDFGLDAQRERLAVHVAHDHLPGLLERVLDRACALLGLLNRDVQIEGVVVRSRESMAPP